MSSEQRYSHGYVTVYLNATATNAKPKLIAEWPHWHEPRGLWRLQVLAWDRDTRGWTWVGNRVSDLRFWIWRLTGYRT